MRVRQLFVAIAGLSLGAVAALAAEPSKAPVSKAEHPAGQHAPVVVAVADTPRAPVVEARDEANPPPAQRHARVTTCRCGGQSSNK
jgi:hypothetical protein